MISPKNFIRSLEAQNVHFYTGVPCSYFKGVIDYLNESSTSAYYIAPNEAVALTLASGAYLAGKNSCVMIQNSGLGNLINPLTSLNLIYRLPTLLFISGRAYGISDEPQHEIMGKKMASLLESFDIPYWDFPQDEISMNVLLAEGIKEMKARSSPVAFFVRKGTFDSYEARFRQKIVNSYSMKRIDAIQTIRQFIKDEDLVFATTGRPSRELFAIGDRPGNFYMQGSMGHVASLALGTALSAPNRRVFVLDGDGAFLMHLGVVSMIGYYQPRRFVHLVLDNESYETTGNQATTSKSTDFQKIAEACGYHKTFCVDTDEKLRTTLVHISNERGPILIRIKINQESTDHIPRITTRYQTHEITESFQNKFNAKGVLVNEQKQKRS